MLVMCKCIQKHSTLLKWDLVIQGVGYIRYIGLEIQLLVCRKKLILICELGCVRGIMHFIIQSALLDYSFPFLFLVCYIRLVYRTSDFQIIAIALTSLVKDTFCLQLRQSNSKLVWLASKKKFLEQVTHSCINILHFEIIIFFPKLNFHWYGSQPAS